MSTKKNHKKKNTKKVFVYAGICLEKNGFWLAIRNGRKHNFEEFFPYIQKKLREKIYSALYRLSIEKQIKIVGVGIVNTQEKIRSLDDLTADLWLKQDIVPFIFDIKGESGERKATSAALEVAKKFGNDDIIDISYDAHHGVRTVRLLRLEDYRKICQNGSFTTLLKLADKFKKQKGNLVFFSSTPRGGGVALMRHALIRLYRLLGLEVSWYVMSSKKAVFEITKKKFHNVLQGVSAPEVHLNDGDREALKLWIEKNAQRFSGIFKDATVIVIDDPQPSGMISWIKKINPNVKIIYRSHIQIRVDLLAKKGTAQFETWSYLWENIKLADIFVSHPIREFIPRSVPKEKIVLMPATTDSLDGLNKPLSRTQQSYYMDMFNAELEKKGQTPLNLKRPYFIQIARFDPSKGIPDLIEAFRKLRNILQKAGKKKNELPQLVIAGHGSIDDPEAIPVYNEIENILQGELFKDYADDIKVARVSHHDQILNVLLRGSQAVLQLSYREGFEVKVSEALEKGKPVIAYRAGGIPLQIENGVTGYLVKVGATSIVAKHLFDLLTDKKLYHAMSHNAKEKVNADYFTVSNANRWLFLATELVEKGKIEGNLEEVKKLMERAKI